MNKETKANQLQKKHINLQNVWYTHMHIYKYEYKCINLFLVPFFSLFFRIGFSIFYVEKIQIRSKKLPWM